MCATLPLSVQRYRLTVSQVLEHTLSTASVFWVAQMGKHELAAASLASLTVNVCCFSVIQGMASALDTLCTQAFTSSHPKDTSLHAMRTAFIISCLLIPMFAILYNAEPIFLLLKQDPIIASMTAKYLRLTALSLPGFTLFEVLRKYSVSQGEPFFKPRHPSNRTHSSLFP